MKKFKIFLLSLLLIPINALAYSDYIIPGGETLGIEINSDGIMVIGFYQINGKYNKGYPNIKAGDYITAIKGTPVNTVDELTVAIEDNKSVTNSTFCNLCGACVTACPQNIRELKRTSMKLTNINSEAWKDSLNNLIGK